MINADIRGGLPSLCAKEPPKHASTLKLFPASRPLEPVGIDIIGPFPRSSETQRFLFVITCPHSKSVRVVPLVTITALTVVKAFCAYVVFPYGPPRNSYRTTGASSARKFPGGVPSLGREEKFHNGTTTRRRTEDSGLDRRQKLQSTVVRADLHTVAIDR